MAASSVMLCLSWGEVPDVPAMVPVVVDGWGSCGCVDVEVVRPVV